jgi:hypothetical protein
LFFSVFRGKLESEQSGFPFMIFIQRAEENPLAGIMRKKVRGVALKKLPIGVESFRTFFTDDYYLVDKTGFIVELMQEKGIVNLFTRPRRFGKSLNMDMLKTFFEVGTDASLFEGLKVSQEKELCEQCMGKFPVISITLKSVAGLTFESACNSLKSVIWNEAMRFPFLAESDCLNKQDKAKYTSLIELSPDGTSAMPMALVEEALQLLCKLLAKHYGTKPILLIDEYDVPLDKAFQAGYYDEMILLIRNLLGNALKTNPDLNFAVLTGCLRISRESIFTGLNNLKVHTITDTSYEEQFGFTDGEVREMLEYYGLSGQYDTAKEWYDGYRFGEINIYCPWDVINFCYDARKRKQLYPKNYWANTSGNGLVRRFIDKATALTKRELEMLVAGENVTKLISQELTYPELDKNIDNLWSVLFTTGYLTQRGTPDGRNYELVIPNMEIRELFVTQIQEWFKDTVSEDRGTMADFCAAFPAGDTEQIEKQLNAYLWKSISIRDTAVRLPYRENFYHGILLGILQYEDNWIVMSNTESGTGYSDILIETPEGIGIVLELKYAGDGNLPSHCEEALQQIEKKQYDATLIDDGMETIMKYGIAFYKKKCKVMLSGRT